MNPTALKILLSAVALIASAAALQWPQYGQLLGTIAGALGGGALAPRPGDVKSS